MKKISESSKISKLIFMGTSDFAVPVFFRLINSKYKPVLLITQPERRSGRRKTEVNQLVTMAENANIPVYRPEDVNSDDSLEFVRKYSSEIIITASYGSILKKRFRSIPLLGCLNIHPSLLPKYRGATPVNYPLFNGDSITGVSIFLMKAKMDTGPIVSQLEYQIGDEDSYTILQEKLSKIGADQLIDTLETIENDGLFVSTQEHKKATYTTKIEKSDLIIDWNDTAQNIINRIKGLAFSPAAQTSFRGKTLKLISAKQSLDKSSSVPGTIIEIIKKSGLVVVTGNSDTIILTKVQPAGKKIMSAFDFNLGARIDCGEKFE